jgi:hypothetical protein
MRIWINYIKEREAELPDFLKSSKDAKYVLQHTFETISVFKTWCNIYIDFQDRKTNRISSEKMIELHYVGKASLNSLCFTEIQQENI